MKRSVTWILGAVLLAVMASPRTTGADLYVLTNNTANLSGGTTTLGKINTTTGAFTKINITGVYSDGDGNISGAAANLTRRTEGSDEFLYFTVGTGNDTQLKKINVGTLVVTSLADSFTGVPFGAFTGMTYDAGATNKFYAWKQEPTINEFGTITWSSLLGTWNLSINLSGPDNFDPPTGGRLAKHGSAFYAAINDFASDTGQFGTVDEINGFTPIVTGGPLTEAYDYKYINLASDSSSLYGLYGNGTIANHKLFTINTTDAPGALTQLNITIEGSDLGQYFHGAAFVPVPEPSTYAMGMIAAVTAGWAMRRKKKRS